MNDTELLECAEAVTKLTTAQFSEEKAKLVVDTASNGGFQIDTLTKLAQIKYVIPTWLNLSTLSCIKHLLLTIYAKKLKLLVRGLLSLKRQIHRLSLIDKAHV